MKTNIILTVFIAQGVVAFPLFKRDPPAQSASGSASSTMLQGASSFGPNFLSGDVAKVYESLSSMLGGAASFTPAFFSDLMKSAGSTGSSPKPPSSGDVPAVSSGTSGSSAFTSMMSYASYLVPGQEGTVKTAQGKMRPDSKLSVIRYGPYDLPAYKKIEAPKGEAGHGNMSGMGGHGGMSGMGGMGGSSSPGPMEGGALGISDMLAFLSGAKTMDPNGISFIKRLSSGMCKDCTVLAGKVNVVSESGKVLGIPDGVYIHHAVTVDVTKPVKKFISDCGDMSGSFSPFMGAGVDDFTQYYTTPDGKFPSGYYVKDDLFLMQLELVNYKETKQQVYVQMDIDWVPGKVGGDATQGFLSATKCTNTNRGFKPPAGDAGKIESQAFQVNVDGSIIAARGHMHDGGTAVNMLINDKLVCASDAVYGSDAAATSKQENGQEWQTIAKMKECTEPFQVKKGDQVKIAATYDMKAHPARESHGEGQEVMGIMTYVFVPKE